ncbi:MAG: cbb3-type cytochrome c oxidase subunit 3 [Bdellovibrionaceae bacterium]|nr:cbb3-type cytochrome c oxidase subunit 3 [Pseudobdellovibrionaceae bacterium]
MKQEALMQFTDTYLTSVGLIIFFLFFMGVLYWTSRKENIALYKKIETMPLIEGGSHE